MGIIYETTIELVKGDARSLDYSWRMIYRLTGPASMSRLCRSVVACLWWGEGDSCFVFVTQAYHMIASMNTTVLSI